MRRHVPEGGNLSLGHHKNADHLCQRTAPAGLPQFSVPLQSLAPVVVTRQERLPLNHRIDQWHFDCVQHSLDGAHIHELVDVLRLWNRENLPLQHSWTVDDSVRETHLRKKTQFSMPLESLAPLDVSRQGRPPLDHRLSMWHFQRSLAFSDW